ncbi:polysaccharide deacetylase family protein [Cytobacillus sp. S13-E01]|uniref:polysaccharide deacetylase family protein n=1 Tax=Cytobacillus sp. S13-E01 TaxID=3031326 RepID=UPI0023D7D3A7|nr:polysaccharide deacetylase family protein [Cytobacillus sp. S13-E01]MDF0725545.1 polysaccharide deacetylase family protein [Cytobacillus sp. S13-E01]
MIKGSFKQKLYICNCLMILLLSLASINVHAQESRLPEAPIFIDENPINTKYIMREGHLLVPALFLKHTGSLVDWNEQYRSVVFQANDKKFAVPLGKKFTDDYDRGTGTWKRGTISTEAIEFNGTAFVPILDVAKKLGMNVRYDPEINRTFITTNLSIKPNIIEQATTAKKLVALTFDDGPENYYTPMILDILKEKAVPATFFVVGRQITRFPEVMKRIVNEGHGIANHSWRHPDLRYTWSSKVREEIQSTQQEMQKVVGRKPDVFRPPYGALTKADIRVLNEIGMRNIMWSVDTLDWSGLSGDEIVKIVHEQISPGGIVLQHNFQSNVRLLDGTVEALPRIIDDLQKQGYKFVTVQTLLAKQKEEQLKAEQPQEDQPSEEQPIENQPTKEQPTEDQPQEDQPSEEQPIENQPIEEQPTEDQPQEGQPSEEQPIEN